MTQTLSKDWLSKQEAADYLGVNPATVMRLVRAGKLTAARVGKLVRISSASIERYLEAAKMKP